MQSAATFVVFGRVYEKVVFRVFEHRLNVRLSLGEGVRDVIEADQAEDGVLVGGSPQLFVELAKESLGRGVGHGRGKS